MAQEINLPAKLTVTAIDSPDEAYSAAAAVPGAKKVVVVAIDEDPERSLHGSMEALHRLGVFLTLVSAGYQFAGAGERDRLCDQAREALNRLKGDVQGLRAILTA